MLNFQDARFRYDPYPIGFARNAVPAPMFGALVDAFPPAALLRRVGKLGNKYMLAEYDGTPYHDFVKSSPPWRDFYDYIKSRDFIEQTLNALCEAKIDMGLKETEIDTINPLSNPVAHLSQRAIRKLRSTVPMLRDNAGRLTSRFEFSVLPADGGSHFPHSDEPRKVISMVLALVKDGEWDPAWGGGTAVCKPKDMTENFNHVNRHLKFDEVEVLEAFPFIPNGLVIFIKTFNSWHSVMPYQALNPNALRKTITINIDYSARL